MSHTEGSLLSRRQLSELMGVHMQTVTKWESNGMPIHSRGRKGKPSLYSETDVRAWLAAREAAAAAVSAPLDVAIERARKEHWQAQLAEQTHKARARELLPAHEVERAWGLERDAIRTSLLAVPASYSDAVFRAGTLHGVSGVEKALKEMAYGVLRELSGEAAPKKRARA